MRSGLEGPASADVPLPVFTVVAAGTAFDIKINMIVLARFKGRADTIFQPGIVKVVADLDPAAAVSHGHVVAAAEFMQ